MGESTYDVVVIGGGHNGAIAALVLSMHGLRVAVVEQNNVLGGLAGGKYVYGVPSSRFAYVIGLVPVELREWLGIWPESSYPDPNWVELDSNNDVVFRWWVNEERLVHEFLENGVDIKDLLKMIKKFWSCYKKLGLYYTVSAPSKEEAAQLLDSCGLAEIVASTSRKILSEFMPRKYWDYFIYPSMLDSSGFVLAYYLQNNNIWGRPRESMTSFSKRIRESLVRLGVHVLLGSRVREIIIRDGRAYGVELSSGERIISRATLFSAPITSLLDIGGYDRLEEYEIRLIERARRSTSLRSRVKRIDYLFSAQPNPPLEHGWRDVPIYVKWSSGFGGEYTYVGQYNGKYLVQFSGFTNDALRVLPPGTSEEELIGYDVRDLRVQVICCSNYTGHPDHLPMIDDYLFDKRPLPGWNDYRTSIPCLYHGSASSYPGGEVNGVAGVNAALRILVDFGIKPDVPLPAKGFIGDYVARREMGY